MEPTHIQRRPSTFLVLAPQSSIIEKSPSQIQNAPSAAQTSAIVADDIPKIRRSSSVGSDQSAAPTELRFLKLGPAHFGGEPGVSDYAE